MPDLVHVTYAQTGQSSQTNHFGMREMQEKAYEARDAQYLLLKAPPASGKSRALMFIALDKLIKQGLKKVIVAVPERSIGGSFRATNLTSHGFYADWDFHDNYNLCTPGNDGSKGKVQAFCNFMRNDEKILICTHATLRFAFEELKETDFDNCLLAIDEFHHVSADGDSKLGELLRLIMEKSTAHIVAMTGSYFRGDSVPVLLPEDEEKFTNVTYTYYEQLNGYTYLKSLGIGYNFYQGNYTEAILDVLDTDKKTILHIPNVNSGESLKRKYDEVNFILDAIGDVIKVDAETKVIYLKRHTDGKTIKVADLVNDNSRERDLIVNYLREMKSVDDIDLIIALGMAKEGFDWPWCEYALTVGYRGSLTEIVQIIGRATRDSNNKTHAQFTNLIAQPDATSDDVRFAVNNMLKAITASLLMEQVLAPNFNFKPRFSPDDRALPGEILVRGYKAPSSKRVKDILQSDINDLKATILKDNSILAAIPGNIDAEVINKVLIKQVIEKKYPNLSEDEVEEVRQYVVMDSVMKNSTYINIKDLKKAIENDESIKKAIAENMSREEISNVLIPKVVQTMYPDLSDDEASTFSKININSNNATENEAQADKRFIRMAGQFVNIDDIHIDLIDQVNPFQRAYEILSKSVTPKVLKVIQDVIETSRIKMTVDEALIYYPEKVQKFMKTFHREPNIKSANFNERRMAEAILFLKDLKRKNQTANNN
ncbi:MAG: ATP-dependent helicase [Paludibacter sp.]|nr:ATP-dependent helicase [Paludibacter sp.]